MREELYYRYGICGLHGITPAHAGRIGPPQILYDPMRDHPRACGKNLMSLISDTPGKGSPPRMREEST